VNALPALVTRPLADAYADALAGSAGPAPAEPDRITLDTDLGDGIPARLPLDGTRSLVLAVPLGVARPLMDADPRTVVLDDRTFGAADPAGTVSVDLPRPRLTLVVDGRIADTVAVVPRRPLWLGDGGAAEVEVVVDTLLVVAGTLRGPGRQQSRLVLRWRSLRAAGDAGPAAVPGDPALDVLRGVVR
jgi:hypothetical protein